MRKLYLLALVGSFLAGYTLRSRDISFDFDLFNKSAPSVVAVDSPIAPASELAEQVEPKPADTIRVASFNIQVFGQSKANKPEVIKDLVEVVRHFDIVAIQEIRSRDQTLIPNFVAMINSDGSQYAYEIGPRLGRTSSKEQYAYLFNTRTIEIDRTRTYTVDDKQLDRMHREPLVSFFRTRTGNPGEAFTFKLVNVRTDPDDVPEEMNALDDVYLDVLDDGDNEDDVIMLGDFNTSVKKLYEFGGISEISWALDGVKTNTLRTRSYDNIFFHADKTREFNGRAGVFDLVRELNLTTQQALAISDHLPVWAEFSAFESRDAGRLATRPEEVQKPR
ncbi:MAG: endonuclease/exonuclease/phosphatase family protein [Planctomycetales bacterium]